MTHTMSICKWNSSTLRFSRKKDSYQTNKSSAQMTIADSMTIFSIGAQSPYYYMCPCKNHPSNSKYKNLSGCNYMQVRWDEIRIAPRKSKKHDSRVSFATNQIQSRSKLRELIHRLATCSKPRIHHLKISLPGRTQAKANNEPSNDFAINP